VEETTVEDSFDESEKKGNDFSEYLLDRVRQLEERNLKLRDANRKVENEKRSAENQKVRYEREVRKLRSELERLKGPPLLVGTVLDVLDDNRVVIKSSTGPKFVVNASQFIEQELIAGARVALNQQSLAIVGALPPSKDPTVYGMEIIETPTVSYDDIGGLDGQIQELRETVELPLLKPELFKRVGIEPPKGVLLYGPPGTGKTLLAKAVAKHTESVFIRIVGSELVQKYIGEGARLVRELFEMAREKAPSIIFIDELDAIGAKRLDSATSGDREVQRTLMQLLAEMDGFENRGDVKIIGATNRSDILDPALLRPGRFDRLIDIPLPTYEARVEIVKIHTSGMNLDHEIDAKKIAKLTEGASGADIKAIAMEAGMFAIRAERESVTAADFDDAVRKVVGMPNVETQQLGSMFA
jgi:proteasome regulatory subunit